MIPFGEEVKRLRLLAGLTQVELAKAARCSQSYLAALEIGRKTGVGGDVLYRISDALGVDCRHFKPFLTGGEDPVLEPPAMAKSKGKK